MTLTRFCATLDINECHLCLHTSLLSASWDHEDFACVEDENTSREGLIAMSTAGRGQLTNTPFPFPTPRVRFVRFDHMQT